MAGQECVCALAPCARVSHASEGRRVAFQQLASGDLVCVWTFIVSFFEDRVHGRSIDALLSKLGAKRALPARPCAIARLDPGPSK